MKILLLAHKEFISLYAVNLLIEQIKKHDIHLAITTKTTNLKNPDPRLSALKNFDQSLLQQADKQNHIELIDRSIKSFDELSQGSDKSLKILDQPHSEENLQWLQALKPDLVVSIRYQRILNDKFKAAVNCPIINLHSGILPEYRGVMPTFRAMSNKESTIGTSLHFIQDATIDTGALIKITKVSADYSQSYYQNTLAIYPESCKNMANIVNSYAENGEIPAQKQSESANYYSHPNTESLDFFEKSHELY